MKTIHYKGYQCLLKKQRDGYSGSVVGDKCLLPLTTSNNFNELVEEFEKTVEYMLECKEMKRKLDLIKQGAAKL